MNTAKTRMYFLQRFFQNSAFLYIHNKLKERRLKSLEANLPEYIHKITFGLNEYTIYKAKEENTPQWNSVALKRLVIECRKSYRDFYYAHIPDLDNDDDMSAIYLVCVSFPIVGDSSKAIIAKKWYSLRFVFPLHDRAQHSIDLETYMVKTQNKKQSLLESMIERVDAYKNFSTDEAKKHIIIISRFCSTPVYIVSDSENLLPAVKEKLRQQTHHGGLSFALMNADFLQDIEKKKSGLDFFVTQMHESLSDKILSYLPDGTKRELELPFADETLGVAALDICIDRDTYGFYIYRYPGYFLDNTDLAEALEYLITSKKISLKTIEKYLENGVSFSDIIKTPKLFHFRKFGDLFTITGRIPGENMTGEELRAYLNAHVKDGPRLRLFDKYRWKKIISQYLDNIQVTIAS